MRRRTGQWVLGALILILLAIVTAGLVTDGTPAEDRAAAISERLRCPVCKSVSIADSPSETAASMRRSVADQVAAGRSDAQILNYFTERYGQWVLLDPPIRGSSLLLWLLPALAAGVGMLVLATRPRRKPDDGPDLPEEDRGRLQAALHDYRLRAEEEDLEP